MANNTGSAISYNIQDADDIAKSIVTMYKSITDKIKEGWGPVSSDFVAKWNNTLSERYEIALSKHMAYVHLCAGALLKDLSLDFINGLNRFIADETNTQVSYGGEEITVNYDLKSYIIDPTDGDYKIDYVSDNEALKNTVKPSTRDYSNGQMSLEDASVAQNLYATIENYVQNVKAVVNNSIGTIEDKKAFEGPTSTQKFTEKVALVTNSLGVLDAWLDKFEDELENLVNVTIKSEEDVANSVSTENNEVNPNQEVF